MLPMRVFSVKSGLKPRRLDSQPRELAKKKKKIIPLYVFLPSLSLSPLKDLWSHCNIRSPI